ncbi:MAG: hypothetical protein K2Z81_06590 [Cyanobacteria bacterium]|nr:hypothetical protein [Cyanobacteriota bacterium]
MTLRWCAYAGAAMIIAVLVSLYLSPADSEPPGEKHRWWDGTLESRERYHSNGNLFSRTTFGDDGESILTHEEWDSDGTLRKSKMRLPDGTLEVKWFNRDKQLERYQLRTGDDQLDLIVRDYFKNGKLRSESISSPDGQFVVGEKEFYESGQLKHASALSKTGEQTEEAYYESGKAKKKHKQSLTGEVNTEWFYENGTLRRKDHLTREEGALIETFTPEGKLEVKHVEEVGKTDVYRTVYNKDGKVNYKQTWTPSADDPRYHSLALVEEFAGKEKPLRIFKLEDGRTVEIRLFREDGTLAMVQHTNRKGEVSRQEEYDDKGEKVVKETQGGEVKDFDPELLKLKNIDPREKEDR